MESSKRVPLDGGGEAAHPLLISGSRLAEADHGNCGLKCKIEQNKQISPQSRRVAEQPIN